MKSTVDAALSYRSQGFSIVPSNPKTKAPLVPWTEYQKRLPTEEEIYSWFKQYPRAMISLVTGQTSGVTVVDADSPEATSKIEETLPEAFELPCTRTPRGGEHFIFAYTPGIPTKAGILTNIDIRNDGGCIVVPPSARHDGKIYTWLGLELSREALQEMPESLHRMLTETQSHPVPTCDLKGAPLINNTNTNTNTNTNVLGGVTQTVTGDPLFSLGRRDSDLFTLANSLVKSGMPEGEIFKYLDFIVRSWGEHDETWINTKIASALQRNEKREKSLSEEIEAWIRVTERDISVTDCDKELGIVTKRDKDNRRQIFKRLLDRGIIERVGTKEGFYRRVLRDYEPMNLTEVSVDRLDIKWPFNLHDKVYMLPKSVAVIAGQTDSGKSAFCLNFAYLNRNQGKIRYLTSEMGAQEIKSRVSLMDVPIETWNQIEFIERSGQFQDLILPDGITVVDYLEKAENFYEIAKDIKIIFDRLKTGFCLIALQKKEGQDFGRGGDFSAEKSRLYLSMSPGRLKITKAKNWMKTDVNPNKLECQFKLVNGIKFIQSSGWKRPD